MHKNFYVSGFLYHPKSQQILLQQENSDDENCFWSLFGKKAGKNKTCEETFIDIFQKELSIELKPRNVNPVYTYSSEEKGASCNVYYAVVKKLHKSAKSAKAEFAWFNFKQVQKLKLSEQAKHDIVVGQRVIDSSVRKSQGLQTIG
ncbi:MAG: hypothetical protein M1372_02765 [Patescibacteria group bacterium]|nr:hypothetical protein [Patescibacteria group bacterium]